MLIITEEVQVSSKKQKNSWLFAGGFIL